ncbi:uncharacterized protein LOC126678474 [Mercurialis annua]|uniref:uncharacterized protein LOC126678474 n=1 Tax=Mercurialis annua TaxID=3986 RepID=UPI00215FDF06|nr:uncharacterized protein LOC126678474 [Mercurialis annua]
MSSEESETTNHNQNMITESNSIMEPDPPDIQTMEKADKENIMPHVHGIGGPIEDMVMEYSDLTEVEYRIKICIWNAQGAGSKNFLRVFKNFCTQYRFDVVSIVEPRISGEKVDNFIKNSGFDYSHRIEATGFSGGIWVLWKDNVKLTVMENNKHFMHLKVIVGREAFLVTIVYANPNASLRKGFWEDISALANVTDMPWLIGGDFNAALNDNERRGGGQVAGLAIVLFFANGICSDHNPIFLQFGHHFNGNSSRKPFRFLAAWLGDKSFGNLIRDNWNPSGSMMESINNITEHMRNWNYSRAKENYTNQRLNILEEKLSKDLEDTLYQEELLWIQKSRCDWVVDGDRNTAYFHRRTSTRRRKNKIWALKNEHGQLVDNPDTLKEMATEYYSKLFTKEVDAYTSLPCQGLFPVLENRLSDQLACAVSDDDIKKAVWHMHPLKAPGVDGLHALFYQSQWPTIGDKVCSFIHGIFNGKPFPPEINKTLITLIPKCDNPDYLKDYRPISLCNVLYKVITKIIANRLKKIMPHIIGPTQTSFVEGRHITDNIILAQEALHTMRKKKGRKGYMVIKLDLEKAYDRVSWDFLHDTLRDIGIPSYLSSVIMSCVSSTSMSILWNGCNLEAFSPSCGIRQGDPISPYLFVLCIERLAQMINMECHNKKWKPLTMGRDCPGLSHLFFADDLLLFGEASMGQVEIITRLLEIFCTSYGQRINKEKSKVLFSPNVPHASKILWANKLGFSNTDDLESYLGVPLLHGRYTKKHAAGVMNRIRTRLSNWNAKSLLLAGRSSLINSVLSAVPIYTMQTTALTKNSCNEIESKCRQFLWGSSTESRKINLIKWDVVRKSRVRGGLGHKNMSLMNEALLMKIGWKILANHDVFWVKILRSKYKILDNWVPSLPNIVGSSHLWQALGKLWGKLQAGVRWALCDGTTIRFWLDPWLGENISLIQVAIAQVPLSDLHQTVDSFVKSHGGWWWSKFENLLPNNWLLTIVNIIPPDHSNGKDFMFWGFSNSGQFSTKSAYEFLDSDIGPGEDRRWSFVWNWPGPERVRFFLWLVAHDRLLTNHERRRRHLTEEGMCPRCKIEDESICHLLRDCCFSKLIWNRVLAPTKITSFFSMNFETWLEANLKGSFNGNGHDDWVCYFGITLSLIWNWRNKYVFDGKFTSVMTVLRDIDYRVNYITAAIANKQKHDSTLRNYRNIFVGWSRPPPGWIKINTDGAFSQATRVGKAGGLARDETGRWLGSFAMCIGRDSVIGAEFRGVYHGLLLGWKLGATRVVIEVDNSLVVEKINAGSVEAAGYSNLLASIQGLLKRNWEVKINHVYREANAAADHLASMLKDNVVGIDWHTVPLFSLIPWLNHDVQGSQMSSLNENLFDSQESLFDNFMSFSHRRRQLMDPEFGGLNLQNSIDSCLDVDCPISSLTLKSVLSLKKNN